MDGAFRVDPAQATNWGDPRAAQEAVEALIDPDAEMITINAVYIEPQSYLCPPDWVPSARYARHVNRAVALYCRGIRGLVIGRYRRVPSVQAAVRRAVRRGRR